VLTAYSGRRQSCERVVIRIPALGGATQLMASVPKFLMIATSTSFSATSAVIRSVSNTPVRWSTDFCAARFSREIVAHLEVTAFSKHAGCSTSISMKESSFSRRSGSPIAYLGSVMTFFPRQENHYHVVWCGRGSFTPAPTPNRTCKFPSIRLSSYFSTAFERSCRVFSRWQVGHNI